jgi:uncharacterized UPF0160 family protein
MPNGIRVAVHDGGFHTDELFCLVFFKYLFKDVSMTIVRSRKPEIWADSDFVMDVGEGLLDHHNSRNDGVSSAASRLYRLCYQTYAIRCRFPQEWWDKVAEIVDIVARHDTGVQATVMFHYISVLSSMQPIIGQSTFTEARQMLLKHMWTTFDKFQVEAKAEIVAKADILKQPKASVVVFSPDTRMADLKKLLWQENHPAIYFISQERAKEWKVLCCAEPQSNSKPEYDRFSCKQRIPGKFCGKDAQAFREATGIADAIFCHDKGFMASFETMESAVEFAKRCVG